MMNGRNVDFIGGPSNQYRPAVVPAGWEWAALSDVARLESGHTPDRKKPEYWNGLIPWVSLQDTTRLDADSISNTAFTVTELGIDNSSARVLPAGTVIFSRTATVGKATILAADMATSQDFANWVCGSKILNRYLMHALRAMEKTWSNLMAGSTHNTIYMPDFKRMCILLPPLREQQAIAAVLSTWDRSIRQFADLIAAKFRFKQGLMQQLLTGQRRFPGFKGEWQQVQLRDVTTECDERNRGQLGMDSVKAVTKAEGIVPMRERTIGADIGRYLIVRKDWFAYNPMRINIGSIARWGGENDVLVSPDYVVFRCNPQNGKSPGIEADYLDHLRRSGIWEKYVAAAGNGSVRVRIYYSDLGHLKFSLPERKEQRCIADVLNVADREICLLQRELDTLKQQKKGLMQKLLTGEIRVGTLSDSTLETQGTRSPLHVNA